MVLKVSGSALAHPYPGLNEPVTAGQKWSDQAAIEVPAGSTITVLLLARGERQVIEGPGQVKVNATGLQLQGCTARSLASTPHKLAIRGENHRQIGGHTLRSNVLADRDCEIDRVEGTALGVTVSRPAGSGAPPSLQFTFSSEYDGPNLDKSLSRVLLNSDRDPGMATVASQGQAVGSRWQWQVPYPKGVTPPATLGLTVRAAEGEPDWLYTKVYVPAAQELEALAEARKDYVDWAAAEPQSSEPWLVYATLLEEKGQLDEARQVLDKALQISPQDPGLAQMKARLLMDLGRYRQAAELLKKVPSPKP
jgi:hypothetical protein